jgi:Stage III sporulation protein D.
MANIEEVIYYMIENQCTIRKASEVFGISKSVVHKRIHEVLPKLDVETQNKLDQLLKRNFANKNIVGGNHTKRLV